MKTVFMGTPEFAATCLKALIDSGEEVAAVFTQPDKARGRRGNTLMPTPVKELSLQHDIPVYQPKSLKSGCEADELYNMLCELKPELIVVAAYGKILPKRILDIPVHGCINVHASLLPRYRGAAPIQRCILNGEKITGVTTMLMGEELDTGDMLLKKQVEIGENETSRELYIRLAEVGGKLLTDTIAALKAGTLVPEKQDGTLSCYADMITKDMCPIDFSDTAENVHHKICGLSESPCALAYSGVKRIKIYHSVLSDAVSDAEAGTVVDTKLFDVVCGDGKCVRFTEVQTDGGKRMSADAFLRGNKLEKGSVLTSQPV